MGSLWAPRAFAGVAASGLLLAVAMQVPFPRTRPYWRQGFRDSVFALFVEDTMDPHERVFHFGATSLAVLFTVRRAAGCARVTTAA